MTTKHVFGADVVENMLKQLPERLARNVTTTALRAGAAVIAKQAKANIIANPSVDSGLLVRSLTSRSRKRSRKGSAVVSVGVARGTTAMVVRKGRKKATKASPARYAHLVEFGTEDMPAEPFMRTAIDSRQSEAVAKVIESAGRGILREARALAGGKKSFVSGRKI